MAPPLLIGQLYAPVLADDDPRPLQVAIALEAALPGAQLDHEVTPAGTARRLPDRDAFLRQAASKRELPMVFHGDEARYVSVRGREVPGHLMPAGAASWEVCVMIPLGEGRSHLEDAVGRAGEASGAWWGSAAPEAAAAIIATQTIHPHLPRPLPAGLPGLSPPWRLRDPRVPHRLGWLNYWSDATARLLGFPDPERDRDLLARSRRIGAAWLVRLADEPLDPSRTDHVEALRGAYDRFPAIGGRG